MKILQHHLHPFIAGIAFMLASAPAQAKILEAFESPTSILNNPADVASAEKPAPATTPKQPALPQKSPKPAQEKTLERDINKSIRQTEPEQPVIEFNFENADLQNLLDYIAGLFNVSFLPDDAIKPMLQTGRGTIGNKVSFRTEKPMTKHDVWKLFTTFLDIAGLALANSPKKGVYRVTSSPNASHMPLPAYIGVDPDTLPDDDTRIRYVYFLTNATVESIRPVIDQLRSASSSFSAFVPLRALILTDKSYNIKSLMKIVLELDKASPPEVMSVLKLKYAGAEDVKKLYDELTKGDDQRGMVARIFGARRQTESYFFPENTRVFAEPRTNTLILFGTQETIKKIEDFVKKIDAELTDDTSPLYIYELQHTDCVTMAEILNKVTQFGIGTIAGQAGSVRDGERYFKSITFTPEKSGNRLVIRADYEDYLKSKEIIEQLDVMQPQVAIEVLIVNVSIDDKKALGAQIRNRSADSLGKNVNAQNSGLNGSRPVVSATGSLMANLIGLATGADAGSTLLSLGAENNIWALFKMLSTEVRSTVVSNPFLVTSNKYKASVKLGETRRIETSTVTAGAQVVAGKDNISANLEVILTPQINSDGIITLEIAINIDEFTSTDPSLGNQETRHIETKAAIANREVLALGGLIRSRIVDTQTKAPILGDIPILGWIFKNKTKEIQKSNLLIFISPYIIQPKPGGIGAYTQRKSEYSRRTLRSTEDPSSKRDPIHRWFFNAGESVSHELDSFMDRKLHAQYSDITTDLYYKSKVALPQARVAQVETPAAVSKQSTVLAHTPQSRRSLTQAFSEGERA